MNICIASVSFNPDLGGVVFDVALEFAKRGHSVSIFTSGGTTRNGEWIDHEKFRFFRVHTFDVPWKLRSYVCVRNPLVERQWRTFLRDVRPDVVHINQLYYQFPYFLVRIAKRSVDRVFVTAHDVMAFSDRKFTRIINSSRNPLEPDGGYQYPWFARLRDLGLAFNPFRNLAIRRYLRSATRIVTVSNALRRAFAENGIQNTVTIHNGVDIQMFAYSGTQDAAKASLGLAGKNVILSVGRLSGEKGRGALFDSFTLVKQKVPNAALVLIGDDAGGKWREDIEARGFGQDVLTLGFVPRRGLRSWYAAADVVVVPSLCFDSFPTINLEAMAASRPVIATCYGGSREVVVDGETGYIVNPLNTEDLSEKIMRVLSDPALARRLGQAGFERVSKHFRLDQQVETLLQYYQVHNIMD